MDMIGSNRVICLYIYIYIYIYIYRRFRGVSPACPPPVTGRSVSFRLRFRFVRVVRAVRAGEAKLRGRMQTVILIAGPPGCEYPGVPRCPGRPFA